MNNAYDNLSIDILKQNMPASLGQEAKTFLRKWQVLISAEGDGANDIALDVSELRCIFTVKYDMSGRAICSLQIYNLNPSTEATILRKGYKVTILAGYQQSRYGVIFSGNIIQAFTNRNNGTDYISEIYAINYEAIWQANTIRTNLAAGSEPRETLQAIANNADKPLTFGKITEGLNRQKMPRGEVLFGDVSAFIRDLTFFDDAFDIINANGEIEITKFNDEIPQGMAIDLSPNNGLIGAPIYSDDGIIIPMLLDSRIRIRSLIRIPNNIILRQQANFNFDNGISSQIDKFESTGEYKIASFTHEGDTYGDIWKTEVIGFSTKKDLMQIR